MANEDVKLYGSWVRPFSWRVEAALKLKGVPYRFFNEDLSDKSPELLKYNPVHKKVPVLVHNGMPIAESLVILEYIDETWKTSHHLLPEDPYERAMARFWSRLIDEKCLASLWKASWSKGEEREKLKDEGHSYLKKLEEQLKGKRFFGGETMGIVDITGNFLAYWVIIIQEVAGTDLFSEEMFPVLWKWAEEFRCYPGIKESLPDKDGLSTYIKGIIENRLNASK